MISIEQEIQESLPAVLEMFMFEPIDDKTLESVHNIVDAYLISCQDNGHIHSFDTRVEGFPEENSIVIQMIVREYESSDDLVIGTYIGNHEHNGVVEAINEETTAPDYSWYDDAMKVVR